MITKIGEAISHTAYSNALADLMTRPSITDNEVKDYKDIANMYLKSKPLEYSKVVPTGALVGGSIGGLAGALAGRSFPGGGALKGLGIGALTGGVLGSVIGADKVKWDRYDREKASELAKKDAAIKAYLMQLRGQRAAVDRLMSYRGYGD